ncbi:MAG TPA: hypothetical protein VMB79_00340 [Jatrophihabitans sp.]|nr:hypothetical protein [Jatrophihabitans sp.]
MRMTALAKLRGVREIPFASTLVWYGAYVALSLCVGVSLLIALPLAGYSSAAAGIAAGAVAAGRAVGAPVWSRQVDRRGSTFVITRAACAHAAAMTALATAVGFRAATPVVLVLAALSSAALPPVTESIRGAWSRASLASHDASRLAAADSVVNEAALLVGPLILGVVALLRWPPGLVAVVGFGSAIAAMRANSRLTADSHRHAEQPSTAEATRHDLLHAPGIGRALRRLLPVLVSIATLLTALSAAEVCISQQARGVGSGVLLATWSALSLVATLAYARMSRAVPVALATAVLLAAPAAAAVAIAISPNTAVLDAAFVVTGLAMGPALVSIRSQLLAMVGPHRPSETFAWVGVIGTISGATGAALAGLLLSSGGLRALAQLVAAVLAVGVVAALSTAARLRAVPAGTLAAAEASELA